MINFRSIGFRLTLWYTAILAGILAVTGAGIWLGLRSSIHQTVDRDLRSRLRTAREYLDLQYRKGGTEHLISELDEPALGPPGTGLQIFDSEGTSIYRSPEARRWAWTPPPRRELPERGITTTRTVNGRPLRVLSAPIDVGIVQLSTSLDAFYDMLEDFSGTALLASPVLLALAAVSGYWMSRRALRPVDTIVNTARRIGDRNLAERLPLPGTEDELHRLSVALNDMLARLEAAFEKTRQFTADASHELRTPVAVVRTTAEVIRSKARTAEDHIKAWVTVETQTRRMSQLIDDLLLLARADDGSSEISVELMDLAQAMREAGEDMHAMARSAGVKLEVMVLGACLIRADYDAIRRLISILLDNAIKFTRPGGEIVASLEVPDSLGCQTAVIRIRDTGVGISPEDLPRIFDRFYRISKDRSRETGGAGLGLSIAQSIVSRHGGKIFVESMLGVGSAVQVELPFEAKLFPYSAVLQNRSA